MKPTARTANAIALNQSSIINSITIRPRGAGYAPHKLLMKYTATIEIEYEDKTGYTFEVTIEGKEHEIVANILMITRGTLQASSALRATCYKNDVFVLCSYVQPLLNR